MLLLFQKGGASLKNNPKKEFPFGEYLKAIRQRKGVSLKKVEEDTGIPNAYLSQLETGNRRRIPGPDRLKVLANYYNVSIDQLLEKAGYLDKEDIVETLEEKIEKTFQHVISDPNFKYGTRLKGKDDYDLDTKRFIIEMYEALKDSKN
jgi:HTH-type transcriptional regulator, competence development regulator